MAERGTVSAITLIDERSQRPLRAIIGNLLVSSERADIALARVRLAALDLTEEEARGPDSCRVLLGQLDASTLLDAVGDHAGPTPELARLADWLASGRLEVRSAGIGAWTPDFSVFRDHDHTATCLVGAHYFGSPQLTVGPSVTAVTQDEPAALLLEGRFQELWDGAHDVAPAIQEVLGRASRRGGDGRAGGADGRPRGRDGRPRGSPAP